MGFASSGSIGSVKLDNSFVSTVSDWNISGPTGDRTPLVASNTKRGNLSFVGSKSWSGSFTTNTMTPPIPGKKYHFVGYKGTHEDSFSSPTESGDIIVTGISTTLDFNSMSPLNWSVNFQGTGPLTEGTGSGSSIDRTTPSKLQCILQRLTVLGDDGAAVDLNEWYCDNISISLTASTSGGKATANSQGWKLYVPGPVDFTAELSLGNNSRAALGVDIGDRLGIEVVLVDGSVITLKWLQVTNFGQCSVQNSSAENVSIPVSTAMDAYAHGAYGEFSITTGENENRVKTIMYPDPILD